MKWTCPTCSSRQTIAHSMPCPYCCGYTTVEASIRRSAYESKRREHAPRRAMAVTP